MIAYGKVLDAKRREFIHKRGGNLTTALREF